MCEGGNVSEEMVPHSSAGCVWVVIIHVLICRDSRRCPAQLRRVLVRGHSENDLVDLRQHSRRPSPTESSAEVDPSGFHSVPTSPLSCLPLLCIKLPPIMSSWQNIVMLHFSIKSCFVTITCTARDYQLFGDYLPRLPTGVLPAGLNGGLLSPKLPDEFLFSNPRSVTGQYTDKL